MNHASAERGKFVGGSAAVFALLILVWWLVILAWKLPPYMMPTPLQVARTIGNRLPDLWDSFLISAEAAGGGLLASMVVGVLVAMVFARSTWVRKLFFPYTILLQTVPIVAIAPLILMWAGQGLFAVGVITFIICLAPIIANTTQGLISVDENRVQLFQMHNASQWQILTRLRLPSALPNMFVGMRISSGIAIIGAITGELFAGSVSVGRGGLGYSIQYANQQLQTAYLFALVIAATVLGFSFFFIVMFFEWLALHRWYESAAGRGDEA
jgi:NitT/TauT family transport system permease protein